MQTISDKSRQVLTVTQERLIEALLQYPTMKAAATAVGITDRTAARYLEMPHFQVAYDQARREMLAEIRSSLFALASKASAGLHALIDDPETPHAVRLRAYLAAIERVIPPIDAGGAPLDQEANVELIPAHLMPYLLDSELERLEEIVQRAEARRADAGKLQ